jgi:hypothetical protein
MEIESVIIGFLVGVTAKYWGPWLIGFIKDKLKRGESDSV